MIVGIWLIPGDERDGLRCTLCNTTRSVKYRDNWGEYCNRCVTSIMENIWEGEVPNEFED